MKNILGSLRNSALASSMMMMVVMIIIFVVIAVNVLEYVSSILSLDREVGLV